jgi:3-hydroxy-9,10-secoandrosta-1,3,5(10)-triene-9,17-dione monooxygenase reductase component
MTQSVEPKLLRNAFGHFATGVTVITALNAKNEPVGMTANSFSSLSLDPPLVLWSIANSASLFDDFIQAEYFAIHALSSAQESLSRQFSQKDGNRFENLVIGTGEGGVPLLEDYHALFQCKRYRQHLNSGDHAILVGEILAFDVKEKNPLLFYRGKYRSLK